MTTFTFRNGNNLSVADDYSNTDTIIVGNDVNDTLSADYSKYDKITLGNGASDTVFAGSVTGGTDTGTAIFGNLFQMTQFFALSSGSARMRKAALVSILVSIIMISWPVHAQTLDQVIREYQGAFGTVPDQAGLAFWVQAIDDGTASFATLSVAFANSPQFQATYGASANTPASVSLVQAFYQHCFLETLPATDPGVQFWANSSLTASQLLQAFAQSPQFINSAAPYIIGFQNLEAAGTPPTPPTSLFALATPPFNMQLPVITGTAQVGRVLTSSTGTWTGATSFAYQWAGNGTPIAGATALTYTPVSSDAGNTLTATVTATGPGGTASATSAPIVVITGLGPLFDEEFNPPNGTSSQTGIAGLTTSDGLFKIDGPWVGTGGNEINPPNAVFTTADPTTQGQPATGFLSLSTYASGGKNYAGEIISNNLPGYGCGYYEARMIVDPQRIAGGVVSFFWMQAGGTSNARTYGPHEFDIEFLLNESWLTSTNTGAVHYTTHPSNATYTQTLSFNPALGYHRYGFLWVPGTLSYTVDGVIVHTVTGSDVASCMGGWIMANVSTGDATCGGGPPASPFSGVYDWFKFWPGVTTVQAN